MFIRVFLMLSLLSGIAYATPVKISSYSAIAVDGDNGNVILSKNADKKLPIASITKLMTAMVLLDANDDMNEKITVTSADVDQLKHTSSRLNVGVTLTRQQMLLLALMSSENRAAHALARTAYPGGTVEFIQRMNDKAKTLGMVNTEFYDPTGLTPANKSTAEDLAIMVSAAISYKPIRADTTTAGADMDLGYAGYHYVNTDALVRADRLNIYLSKTGFTNDAGHCLVLYTVAGKKPLIMVFLANPGKNGRLEDAARISNYVLAMN